MTDELRALDEFLAGDEPDYSGEVVAPRDAPNAARMLRRLGILYERQREIDAAYTLRKAQLDAWRDIETDKLKVGTEWLEGALARYHAAVLELDPDLITVTTPDGDLTSRLSQPEWQFTDPAAFIAWALTNDRTLLRFPPLPEPEIDKAAVKKKLVRKNEKGDVLERGVVVIPEDDEGKGAVFEPPGLEVLAAERKFTPVPKGYVLAVDEDEVGVA